MWYIHLVYWTSINSAISLFLISLVLSDEGWNIPKYYKMALSLVAGWSMMSFLINYSVQLQKILPIHYLVRFSVPRLDYSLLLSQTDVLPSHPGPREMELLPDLQLWDEEPKTDWLNQILLMLHWLVMTNVPWTPLLEFWHETGTFGTEKLERDWTKPWSRNLRVSAGFSGAMSLSTSTQISLAI